MSESTEENKVPEQTNSNEQTESNEENKVPVPIGQNLPTSDQDAEIPDYSGKDLEVPKKEKTTMVSRRKAQLKQIEIVSDDVDSDLDKEFQAWVKSIRPMTYNSKSENDYYYTWINKFKTAVDNFYEDSILGNPFYRISGEYIEQSVKYNATVLSLKQYFRELLFPCFASVPISVRTYENFFKIVQSTSTDDLKYDFTEINEIFKKYNDASIELEMVNDIKDSRNKILESTLKSISNAETQDLKNKSEIEDLTKQLNDLKLDTSKDNSAEILEIEDKIKEKSEDPVANVEVQIKKLENDIKSKEEESNKVLEELNAQLEEKQNSEEPESDEDKAVRQSEIDALLTQISEHKEKVSSDTSSTEIAKEIKTLKESIKYQKETSIYQNKEFQKYLEMSQSSDSNESDEGIDKLFELTETRIDEIKKELLVATDEEKKVLLEEQKSVEEFISTIESTSKSENIKEINKTNINELLETNKEYFSEMDNKFYETFLQAQEDGDDKKQDEILQVLKDSFETNEEIADESKQQFDVLTKIWDDQKDKRASDEAKERLALVSKKNEKDIKSEKESIIDDTRKLDYTKKKEKGDDSSLGAWLVSKNKDKLERFKNRMNETVKGVQDKGLNLTRNLGGMGVQFAKDKTEKQRAFISEKVGNAKDKLVDIKDKALDTELGKKAIDLKDTAKSHFDVLTLPPEQFKTLSTEVSAAVSETSEQTLKKDYSKISELYKDSFKDMSETTESEKSDLETKNIETSSESVKEVTEVRETELQNLPFLEKISGHLKSLLGLQEASNDLDEKKYKESHKKHIKSSNHKFSTSAGGTSPLSMKNGNYTSNDSSNSPYSRANHKAGKGMKGGSPKGGMLSKLGKFAGMAETGAGMMEGAAVAEGAVAGGGMLAGAGSLAMAALPWVAGAAAVGAIGYGVYNLMIDDDSQEVVDKLEAQGAIEHNFFGDSEIKDWEPILRSSNKDLDALGRYDDWSEEDKKLIEELSKVDPEVRGYLADGLHDGTIAEDDGKFNLYNKALMKFSSSEVSKDDGLLDQLMPLLSPDTTKAVEGQSPKKKEKPPKPKDKTKKEDNKDESDKLKDADKPEEKVEPRSRDNYEMSKEKFSNYFDGPPGEITYGKRHTSELERREYMRRHHLDEFSKPSKKKTEEKEDGGFFSSDNPLVKYNPLVAGYKKLTSESDNKDEKTEEKEDGGFFSSDNPLVKYNPLVAGYNKLTSGDKPTETVKPKSRDNYEMSDEKFSNYFDGPPGKITHGKLHTDEFNRRRHNRIHHLDEFSKPSKKKTEEKEDGGFFSMDNPLVKYNPLIAGYKKLTSDSTESPEANSSIKQIDLGENKAGKLQETAMQTVDSKDGEKEKGGNNVVAPTTNNSTVINNFSNGKDISILSKLL